MIFSPFSLHISQRLVTFDRPAVMGILNVTPDSFFAASRATRKDDLLRRIDQLISEGADIIDIGGYSSRPGADDVSEQTELDRLYIGINAIRSLHPTIPISVDTFRSRVARAAIEEMNADIINDISGGLLDPEMLPTAADMQVPYILMHMRGTPATMQHLTNYPDGVVSSVISELSTLVAKAEELGIADLIIDPGFGFAKTTEQNYELMRHLPELKTLIGRPVLAGISRKSMLTRPLGISPNDALQATTSLNTIALMQGASILRVHDVLAARQAVTITQLTLTH